MSVLRSDALLEVLNRKSIDLELPNRRLSELFGMNVFGESSMMAYLTREAFTKVKVSIESNSKIDRKIADQVACGMKEWALSKGATHYTHWFQPLTGATAEKHDAFFCPLGNGRSMEKFSGSMLVQQEPDASSFPNGGIRNTFEARGYTAWDPSSPAFIMGNTLCVPTIFVSYTGEALDHKTPLLKSLHAIDNAATKVAKYFDKNVDKVHATLGWEQEYFLVDRALYYSRPDLVLTGRTLFGHAPAKGQQLDDHYFGSIPSRVLRFIRELEVECIKLGIPVTTRHNEVAPGQYELAPVYQEVNLAVDHNSLLRDVMNKVARKHNFKVLFHEKPFAGVNGSGKHNNWSLATSAGVNLLAPGKTPKNNLQFLTFFISTIKAVREHADLLRASISSAGNDHRLGANEAPPAIISVFIGSQLTKVLDELEQVPKGRLSAEEKSDLKLNVVGKIPEILLDNTDRNRTSPFAFTGNKFEFRAVGSTINCAQPMTVLNTIVAQQLKDFKAKVDALVESGLKKDEAIFGTLREYIEESRDILFEGDGYSGDWVKKAESRGLKNIKTTPQALGANVSKKTLELYKKNNVMTEVEAQARYEIQLDEYLLRIQIEARVLGDLARNHVIPTAVKYQNTLIENVKGLKQLFGEDFKKYAREQLQLIERISAHIFLITSEVEKMVNARKRINGMDSIHWTKL